MSQEQVITPLTPEQAAAAQKSAEHESLIHRDLVAVDVAINTVALDGLPDETISSHMARWETKEHGVKHAIGHVVSEGLDLIEHNHGALAEEADLTRALEVIKTEESTGTLPTQ